MRKHSFENGEYYHIFNRGVEKRNIFLDKYEFERFMQSMHEFNSIKPIGSLYENSFIKDKLGGRTPKQGLAEVICYCLNPNHYHLILKQLVNGGISEFIKRLSGGYTNYFNKRYKRSGVLFQGKFKSVHVRTNEQLLHASAYVNLNNHVHRLKGGVIFSSWEEYTTKNSQNLCKRDTILEQFNNLQEYKDFAESSLKDILEHKQARKDLEYLLLDDNLGVRHPSRLLS